MTKEFQNNLAEDFLIINHMYNQTKLIVREIAKVKKAKYNSSSIRSWKKVYIIEYSLPYDGPQEHSDGSVTMIDDGVMQIYVDKKSEMGDYYGKTIEGNNWKNGKITKYGIGHCLGGFFFLSKPYYYAFEVWGEGYMQWEEDDYIDDGNKGYLFDKPWEAVW